MIGSRDLPFWKQMAFKSGWRRWKRRFTERRFWSCCLRQNRCCVKSMTCSHANPSSLKSFRSKKILRFEPLDCQGEPGFWACVSGESSPPTVQPHKVSSLRIGRVCFGMNFVTWSLSKKPRTACRDGSARESRFMRNVKEVPRGENQ